MENAQQSITPGKLESEVEDDDGKRRKLESEVEDDDGKRSLLVSQYIFFFQTLKAL